MARKEENGSIWPWLVGGVVVAGSGIAAFFFWPSEAIAGEVAAPLTESEAKQVPAFACLCWRAGNRTNAQLANCVFKRYRPKAPTSGTTFADVKRRTDLLINQAKSANQDLCDFIEGKTIPPIPPVPPTPKKDRIPNRSGDPKGYNTKAFANFIGFRNALNMMGYSMSIEDKKPPASKVKKFQNDWNEVVAGIAEGVVKGPWTQKPKGYHLKKDDKIGADGIAGADLANSLEVAQVNLAGGRSWATMVAQAKAAKALEAVKKLFGE